MKYLSLFQPVSTLVTQKWNNSENTSISYLAQQQCHILILNEVTKSASLAKDRELLRSLKSWDVIEISKNKIIITQLQAASLDFTWHELPTIMQTL